MTPFTVRAPGKVMLFGEYAVVEGEPNAALVAAVSRHVSCRCTPGGDRVEVVPAGLYPPPAPGDARLAFVDAVLAQAVTPPPGRYVVESAEFFTQTPEGDRMKLGLGSSAAVTVCLTAALAVAAGRDLEAPDVRQDVFDRALRAHRAASGGGSGADVAACTFGGLVRVALGPESGDGLPSAGRPVRVQPVTSSLRTLHLIFAGASADTRLLLGAVRGSRERLPDGVWAACMTELDAARLVAESALAGDRVEGTELAAAISRGRTAVEALAAATGTPLSGPGAVRRAVAELASELGGTWKTTGAGGGDLYWLFVPGAATPGSLADRAALRGLPLWSLPIARQGVHVLGV
jgi:phosphomevalonate kinase